MKGPAILLSLLCCLFLSCSKENVESAVLIRVNNQIDARINHISIFSGSSDGQDGREVKYGSLAPGFASGYQQHWNVDGIPLFRFTLPDGTIHEVKQLRCTTPTLTPGKYSLLISDDLGYILVRFEKD